MKIKSEESRRIIVSLDPISHRIGEVECLYVLDFLKLLWKEQI